MTALQAQEAFEWFCRGPIEFPAHFEVTRHAIRAASVLPAKNTDKATMVMVVTSLATRTLLEMADFVQGGGQIIFRDPPESH